MCPRQQAGAIRWKDWRFRVFGPLLLPHPLGVQDDAGRAKKEDVTEADDEESEEEAEAEGEQPAAAAKKNGKKQPAGGCRSRRAWGLSGEARPGCWPCV